MFTKISDTSPLFLGWFLMTLSVARIYNVDKPTVAKLVISQTTLPTYYLYLPTHPPTHLPTYFMLFPFGAQCIRETLRCHFSFLILDSLQDTMDWGSARRKASAYTNNTNTE
jgi:hypothetical protein